MTTGRRGTGTRGRRRAVRTRHRLMPGARATMAGVVALALVATAGMWTVTADDRPPGGTGQEEPCRATVTVAVTAAPSFVPVLDAVQGRLARPHASLGGACVALAVTARESADVAGELSRAGSGAPGATGESPSPSPTPIAAAPPPDVWVPDSSLWLSLARDSVAGAVLVPAEAPVMAVSPVVIAMDATRAPAIGRPGTPLGLASLLSVQAQAGADRTQLALPDPSRSSVGVLTLLGLTGAAGTGQEQAALLDMARSVSVTPSTAAPFRALRDGTVAAVAATEQAVLEHNAAVGSEPLVVFSADDVPALADFPLVRLRHGEVPGTDDPGGTDPGGTDPGGTDLPAAIDVLQSVLTGPDGAAAVTAANLRGPSGELPRTGRGRSGQLATSVPADTRTDPVAVRRALQAWATAGRRGNVLAVIDVSGSMAEGVEGNDLTRMDLARDASLRALSTFAPDTELGVWTFATELRGTADHLVLAGTAPLSSTVSGVTHRERVAGALTGLQAQPGGGTGLYDTTFAAFHSVETSYSYGRLNAVVIITDGRDDDENGIGREALLEALAREFDPERPVRVITVSMGDAVDPEVLGQISGATGARSYAARDPRDIDQVLLEALASL